MTGTMTQTVRTIQNIHVVIVVLVHIMDLVLMIAEMVNALMVVTMTLHLEMTNLVLIQEPVLMTLMELTVHTQVLASILKTGDTVTILAHVLLAILLLVHLRILVTMMKTVMKWYLVNGTHLVAK